MFERTARGWEMMKQSWRVLQQDKSLMLFPIMSSIACLLIMASFALPLIVSPTWRATVFESMRSDKPQQLNATANVGQNPGANHQAEGDRFQFNREKIVPAIVAFAFYLTTSFVIVFFNTALVCCALDRFNGGNPTLSDGLSAAMARLPQILGWALLAATVGTILRQIEGRVPMVGKFAVSLIGMAWAVVTFLVVPILAAEKLGPAAAAKRSASLLRKTWGEALVGQVSLSAVQLVFFLPVIAAVVVAGVISGVIASYWPIAITGAVAVLFLILLSIVFSTLQQIFLAAVYQYAAQGTVPTGFSQSLVESAFTLKQKK
jgi:hypothetical protein